MRVRKVKGPCHPKVHRVVELDVLVTAILKVPVLCLGPLYLSAERLAAMQISICLAASLPVT